MTQTQTQLTQQQEIRQALRELGYSARIGFDIEPFDDGTRCIVYVLFEDEEPEDVGIYDFERHEFMD